MSRQYYRPSGKPITEDEIKRSFEAYDRWYKKFAKAERGLDEEYTYDTYRLDYINAVLAGENNIARTFAYEQLRFKSSEAKETYNFILENAPDSNFLTQLKKKYPNLKEFQKISKSELDFMDYARKIAPNVWDLSEQEREEKYGDQIRAMRSKFEGALYKNESIQKSRRYTRANKIETEDAPNIRMSDFYA